MMRTTQLVLRGLTHYWRTNLAVVARRGHGGCRARRRAARRRLGARQPARPGARSASARPITSSSPQASSAKRWPQAIRADPRFASRVPGVAPLDRRAGHRHRSGERAARRPGARLRRRRSVLALPRRRRRPVPPIARRSSARRWRARSASAPRARHPRPRAAAVRHAARIAARPQGRRRPDAAPDDRARPAGRRRSASSRSSRSRATCAPCSCRSRGCRRSSRSAAASTRCSSRRAGRARRRRPDAATRIVRARSDARGRRARGDDGRGAAARSSWDRPPDCSTTRQVAAAESALAASGTAAQPVFTYLANTHARRRPRDPVLAGHGARSPTQSFARPTAPSPSATARSCERSERSIVLTEWAAARPAGARRRSRLTLEYYVWEDRGQLVTRSDRLPRGRRRADRRRRSRSGADVPRHHRLAVARPTGIRRFRSISRRVRPVDEQYWDAATARRRRRSSRSRSGSASGDRATAR